MPIVNGAAKEAARRSMRGCTGITATGRSSARSSMRRKRRFERSRKEPACLWTTSWADRGAPPGVSSMIGTTTVLHSLRRMENRAAKDPELHAYMTSVRQMFASHRPPTGH